MPVDGGVFSSVNDLDLDRGVGVSGAARVGLCSGVLEKSSHSANLEFRKPLSGDRRSKESLSFGELPICTVCMRL